MSLECAQAAGTGPPHSLEPANRTRFPFFSDIKGDHWLVLSTVETVVLAFIFVVSLLGNVCALVQVARRRRRGTTACLVLNLFCADLLFTSSIPPVLVVRWTEAWLLGPVACHLVFYVMCLSGSVSILTLAAVSLERMVCIARLQRGVRGPGRRERAVMLAFIWVYSALSGLPICVFFQVVQQRPPGAHKVSAACAHPAGDSDLHNGLAQHCRRNLLGCVFCYFEFLGAGTGHCDQLLQNSTDHQGIEEEAHGESGLLREPPGPRVPAGRPALPHPLPAHGLLLHLVEPHHHRHPPRPYPEL
ncbi:free fatty acid receptor 4 isoform X3 [Dasypus novemcinctus]|uniref:free fatty acid receptor 4 isoform X3 n=1 Tax=Dasypus novemcinctus TaxID=9361 RepID=UPI000328B107|nr:free fatty acid receptor 4 isoform X3 [Dasypus novemcinctus]